MKPNLISFFFWLLFHTDKVSFVIRTFSFQLKGGKEKKRNAIVTTSWTDLYIKEWEQENRGENEQCCKWFSFYTFFFFYKKNIFLFSYWLDCQRNRYTYWYVSILCYFSHAATDEKHNVTSFYVMLSNYDYLKKNLCQNCHTLFVELCLPGKQWLFIYIPWMYSSRLYVSP